MTKKVKSFSDRSETTCSQPGESPARNQAVSQPHHQPHTTASGGAGGVTWATWTGRVAHATMIIPDHVPAGGWDALCGSRSPLATYRLAPWIPQAMDRCPKCEALSDERKTDG